MSTRSLYYLGLGSNIEPAINLTHAIETLHRQFGCLIVWPVVQTQPDAIKTRHLFLNSLVVLQSDWSQQRLKDYCNTLEQHAGRDRNDPARSLKDRPLDIDILATQHEIDLDVLHQFGEPYMQAVINSATPDLTPSDSARNRVNFTHTPHAVTLTIFGHPLGQRTAAIDTDHTGGHVVIIEDSVNRLLQRFETPFFSE